MPRHSDAAIAGNADSLGDHEQAADPGFRTRPAPIPLSMACASSTARSKAPRTLQGDGSDPITWNGSWKAIEGRTLLGSRAWRTSTPRDRLDIRLKGTSAALVATVSPWGGRIRVIVNGVKGPVIDLRSEVVRHRRIVWSAPLGGRQPHEISVVVRGRRGSEATDVTVQIDAVLAIRTLGPAWTHGSPGTDRTKRSEGS